MSELKTIARHAGTVLVGQLAVMAFGVADTVIAGRFSDTALAALSVGSAIYISVYVGLIGIVQALLPIWAELLGANKYHKKRYASRPQKKFSLPGKKRIVSFKQQGRTCKCIIYKLDKIYQGNSFSYTTGQWR